MAFDWRDFFLFAHELRNETEESKQRTSVGRAYYYAYNAALIEAKKLGFNSKSPSPRNKSAGVHQKLWDWCLSQTGNQDLIDLGDSGNTLKGRRTSVDYNRFPSPALSQTLVQQQLDETRSFEVLLAQIANTSPPPPLP
jgi:hypothetical protein